MSRSIGSPTFRSETAWQNAASNSSATSSTTMKRLAEMQLCPLFWLRDRQATRAAAATSASASTTKGSEPPSSRTDFFSTDPATSATLAPAASLPVRVTAATRRSRRTRATASDPTSRVWNTPDGKPACRKASSAASAAWGTLEACFRTMTLPPIRAGMAARKTCQSGKFHGMTARITPSGWKRT